MTAQELAERCAELGLPFSRSVIASLESGRRPLVSVAELLALSVALEVPPVLLVMPVGRRENIEIFPGFEVPAWGAVEWFTGEIDIRDGEFRPADNALTLYRDHASLLAQRRRTLTVVSDLVKEPDAELAGRIAENLPVIDRLIRRLRAEMDRRGLLLPPLPPELAGLDGMPPG